MQNLTSCTVQRLKAHWAKVLIISCHDQKKYHSAFNTSFFLFPLKATGTPVMPSRDGNGAQYCILQNPGSV